MNFRLLIYMILPFQILLNYKCITDPSNSLVTLDLDEAIKKMDIELVSYDMLLIQSQSDFVISSKQIDQILITKIFDDQVAKTDTIIPRYKGSSGSYRTIFEHKIRFHNRFLKCDLEINFCRSDNEQLTIDTTLLLYKYPYENTEIFFNIHENIPDPFQELAEFDIIGEILFYCNTLSAYGTCKYNFSDDTFEEYMTDYIGEHITGDSLFLFQEYQYPAIDEIFRYKRSSNEIDLWYDLTSLGDVHDIQGLCIYNNSLYALILVEKELGDAVALIQFDYLGNIINIINEQSEPSCYFLAIYEDIVYSIGTDVLTSKQIIKRYNLKDNSFLPYLIAPARDPYGIRIYDNMLYFNEYAGKAIFKLPLNDLRPMEE